MPDESRRKARPLVTASIPDVWDGRAGLARQAGLARRAGWPSTAGGRAQYGGRAGVHRLNFENLQKISE